MANVLYAEDSDGWYVPIIDRAQVDFAWPANQLLRRPGLQGQAGADRQHVERPREYLCPSDQVSVLERQDSQYNFLAQLRRNLTDWYIGDWYGMSTPTRAEKLTTVGSPASKLFFTEGNDWWLIWKGADYERKAGTSSVTTQSCPTRTPAARARPCTATPTA